MPFEYAVDVPGGKRTPAAAIACDAIPERLSEREVGRQAARVVQELADGDRRARRQQAWQPSLDGVLQREALILDELQDDRGDERLRRALDCEAVLWACTSFRIDVSPADGALPDSVFTFDDRDRPGAAVGGEGS